MIFYNITGTDGSVMVPVLNETGSLMTYLLYPAPTGTLQELYSCKAIPRPYPGHYQAMPMQSDDHTDRESARGVRDINSFLFRLAKK